jgi:hypothetical protein
MKACVSRENQVSLTYNQLWVSPDSRNKHSEEATGGGGGGGGGGERVNS